jgi:hypothetical protein
VDYDDLDWREWLYVIGAEELEEDDAVCARANCVNAENLFKCSGECNIWLCPAHGISTVLRMK